jgi:3',5'-cyclic AMP phosphodiesterase CpdA
VSVPERRIGLVSDVHMRNAERDSLRRTLRTVVDRLEWFDPHHAFVLGDLVEHEATAEADRRNVEAVREAFESTSFGTTYLLGNHDVENLDHGDLAGLLGGQPPFGHVDVEGQDVVYLDSSAPRLPGARGEVGEEQLAYLEAILPTLSGALLLVHHPIGYYDIRENQWFGEFPERAFLGDRRELLEVVSEAGTVRATFSGHIHETRSTTFWGVDHAVVNAFSKELPEKPVTGTHGEVIDVEVFERASRVGSFVLG